MKKFAFKKWVIGLLAVTGITCFSQGLMALRPSQALASSAVNEDADFSIAGASIRLAEPDGLRFVAQIKEGVLTEGAEYGMVLIPEDMDTGADLTKDTTSALVIPATGLWSEELCVANGIEDGYTAFSCALIAAQKDGEPAARFPLEFYNRPITAVAYLTAEGETTYTEKVTRSMTYVAAVESSKPDYEPNLLIEEILSNMEMELSVNDGNKLVAEASAYAPTLLIGGVSSAESALLSVTYSSNNEDVAKIVDGKVQAVADGSATITATLTVGGEKTFTATTEVSVTMSGFAISATAGTAGGGVTGSGVYAQGDSVTLTATTNKGYTFLGWYDSSDTKVETAESYTFTAENDIVLKAKWKQGALSEEEQAWKDTQGYNYFYYPQLGEDVMPIGAFNAPPPPWKEYTTDYITDENYQILAESGINSPTAQFEYIYSNNPNGTNKDNGGIESILKSLDCAQRAGIVYIVKEINGFNLLADGATPEEWALMEAYMSHPAYGGTLLADEPGYNRFNSIAGIMNSWKANEVYGDNKSLLVHSLPMYANAAQLYYGMYGTQTGTPPIDFTSDYEGWVRQYVEMVRPQVYSYDFYPFYGGAEGVWHTNYYQNLSVIREVCMEYNIPFWTWAQAGTFDGPRGTSYAELAIQAHTALAYGAKGIQWFTYWRPYHYDDTTMPTGLVDREGKKTKYYDYVKSVNTQIAAVDHVLMKSKSAGVIQVGSSVLGEIPSADKLTSHGALTSANGIGNALIGCFDYRDQGYAYYVASNDIYNDATITLNFNGTYALEKIQSGVSKQVTAKSITVNVPAGEGVLVVVPKETTSASSPCTVSITNDSTLGNVFGADTYGAGDEVVVAAEAKPGYVFDGWYVNGAKKASTDVYTFTVSENTSLTTQWKKATEPFLINDCEAKAGVDVPATTTVTPSYLHVTSGICSLKVQPAGWSYLNIYLGMDCATLQAMCDTITFDVYSEEAMTLYRKDGATPAVSLAAGESKTVTINTEDLTQDGDFTKKYLTLWAGGAGTIYLDNVVGYPSGGSVINDCETKAGVDVPAATTVTTSTLHVTRGNYSLMVQPTGWSYLNIYLGMDCATLQAKYDTIAFDVYSEEAMTLFRKDGATPEVSLSAGESKTVTINTADLTQDGNFTGNYLTLWAGGAGTIYLDNVVGKK